MSVSAYYTVSFHLLQLKKKTGFADRLNPTDFLTTHTHTRARARGEARTHADFHACLCN